MTASTWRYSKRSWNLVLQRRLCLLAVPGSNPIGLPATRQHPLGHGLDRDSDENPLDCRGHHRLHGFWSSGLHWSDRYILGCDHFFCAGTVLMSPHNGAVNLDILVVCFGSQQFKDPLPNTPLAPAHVTSMNHPKVAKALGHTPGNTDAITVEHCLDKEAVILGNHSDGSNSAGE